MICCKNVANTPIAGLRKILIKPPIANYLPTLTLFGLVTQPSPSTKKDCVTSPKSLWVRMGLGLHALKAASLAHKNKFMPTYTYSVRCL